MEKMVREGSLYEDYHAWALKQGWFKFLTVTMPDEVMYYYVCPLGTCLTVGTKLKDGQEYVDGIY